MTGWPAPPELVECKPKITVIHDDRGLCSATALAGQTSTMNDSTTATSPWAALKNLQRFVPYGDVLVKARWAGKGYGNQAAHRVARESLDEHTDIRWLWRIGSPAWPVALAWAAVEANKARG